HQCQRIRARRDASAAIGNDALFEGTSALKVPSQLLSRQKLIRFRVQEVARRDVYASFDVARPAIVVDAARALMLPSWQSIDRANRSVVDCIQHFLLARYQRALLSDHKARRRSWPGGTGFDR